MVRVDWRQVDLAGMLARGMLAPDIAAQLGCGCGAVRNAVQRYGLSFSEKARRARCSIVARKAAAVPGERERRRACALATKEKRMAGYHQWRAENPDKAREGHIKGAALRWQRANGWCPPQFEAARQRLIYSRRLSAAKARAALEPEVNRWLETFEGKLWLLSVGRTRVVPNVPPPSRLAIGAFELTGRHAI